METGVTTMLPGSSKCAHCKKPTKAKLGVRLQYLCEGCYAEWFKLRDGLIDKAWDDFISNRKDTRG